MTGELDLQANAWLPGRHDGVRAEASPYLDDWTIRERGALRPHLSLFADQRPDLTKWNEAGWGLVLADHPDLDDRQRAEATDAPAAIRQLLDFRAGSPVLRYRPELGSAYFMLCERGQEPRKVKTAGGEQGRDARQVPHYLLIVGSPKEVPWQVQYVLNATHFVGRLDLDDIGLTHYVAALIDGWPSCVASRKYRAHVGGRLGRFRHHLADASRTRRETGRQVPRRSGRHDQRAPAAVRRPPTPSSSRPWTDASLA